MTARPIPKRHWRSYGDDPLPSGAEALDEPFSAFPSWFMRITCDRCGKDRILNEAHTAQRDQPIRTILTTIGVSLGIALFIGIEIINQSTLASFKESIEAVAGKHVHHRIGAVTGHVEIEGRAAGNRGPVHKEQHRQSRGAW